MAQLNQPLWLTSYKHCLYLGTTGDLWGKLPQCLPAICLSLYHWIGKGGYSKKKVPKMEKYHLVAEIKEGFDEEEVYKHSESRLIWQIKIILPKDKVPFL